MKTRTIAELVEDIRRADRAAGAYSLVEIDLAAHGFKPEHAGAAFVREQTERAHRDHSRALTALHAAQAKCSHAFERIGEAKPPFHRCVKCGTTRSDEPTDKRGRR